VESLPKALTFQEQGYPVLNIDFWYGFLAPAGTPSDIINFLNAEITGVLKDPEIVNRYMAQSIEIVPGKPEDFARLLADEVKFWPVVVDKAGAKID
jgi:tripartite-type tricarboxylate transporter receptor subunit TctC